MKREDKFVGLLSKTIGGPPLDFGNGAVAVFELAFPHIDIVKNYRGGISYVTQTHFNANLESVRLRAANLKLPINYGKVPWSLTQERAAEQAILAAR